MVRKLVPGCVSAPWPLKPRPGWTWAGSNRKHKPPGLDLVRGRRSWGQGVAHITCARDPSEMVNALPQAFFYCSSHKYKSFQTIFLISNCLLQLRHFKEQRLELRLLFLCYVVSWSRDPSSVCLNFRLFPAGFSRLPSFYPSLFLISSLCPPHPSCQISLHSPVFHVDGGGWWRRRGWGKLATPGSDTCMHDACKIDDERRRRKITEEMLSVVVMNRQLTGFLFVVKITERCVYPNLCAHEHELFCSEVSHFSNTLTEVWAVQRILQS